MGPLSPEQRALYERQGYLVLEGFAAPLVGPMAEQTMEAWRQVKGPFDAAKTWLQNSLLLNIHHHSALVRDYYFGGPLLEVATQLIGPNIKGATSQLTFKLQGNTMPFGWHQDNGCAPPPRASNPRE